MPLGSRGVVNANRVGSCNSLHAVAVAAAKPRGCTQYDSTTQYRLVLRDKVTKSWGVVYSRKNSWYFTTRESYDSLFTSTIMYL